MKKGIVIRAFSDNPGFLANVGFLASVEDYARCFDRAVEAGFEGIAPFLHDRAQHEAGLESFHGRSVGFGVAFYPDQRAVLVARKLVASLPGAQRLPGILGS